MHGAHVVWEVLYSMLPSILRNAMMDLPFFISVDSTSMCSLQLSDSCHFGGGLEVNTDVLSERDRLDLQRSIFNSVVFMGDQVELDSN